MQMIMWKYRDKSVFKRSGEIMLIIGLIIIQLVEENNGVKFPSFFRHIVFDEEWFEDDKIITWPSLTKVYSASSALVGERCGIL